MNRTLVSATFLIGALTGGAAVAITRTDIVPAAYAAAPASANRVFEIRTYTVDDGQLPALLARFRDHTVSIFNAHGMTSVGYWTPLDTARARTTLIYVLAHPSREAAAQNWTAFRNDPEWQRVQATTTAAGLAIRKLESVFVEPTDFSAIK